MFNSAISELYNQEKEMSMNQVIPADLLIPEPTSKAQYPADQYKRVIAAIEAVVFDDFCADLDYDVAFHPETLSDREKIMAEKLSRVYRISHSWNPDHSCHKVHEVWRGLVDG